MSRFYIIAEDYSVTKTDDVEMALDASNSAVVIDTHNETTSDPQEDDVQIEEYDED